MRTVAAATPIGKVEREGRRDDVRPLQSEAVTVRISRLRLERDDEPEATCHGQRLPSCRVSDVAVLARGPALGWERRTNASSRAAPDATSDQRQSVEDYGADVSTAERRMPRSSSGHETRRSNPHGVALKLLKRRGLLREIDQKCLKRRRMRCRRVHVYSSGPRRPQGDLFGRD